MLIPYFTPRAKQKLIVVREHNGIGTKMSDPEDTLNHYLQNGWHVVHVTPLSNSVQYIIEEN